MALLVTALYAGLLGLIGLVLAGLVGRARGKSGVSLGDGGKPELIEAVRRHANFVEFVPLLLILFAIIEINGGAKWWLHVMGIAAVVCRVAHPIGLRFDQMNSVPRIIGAGGTFLTTAAACVTVLYQALG